MIPLTSSIILVLDDDSRRRIVQTKPQWINSHFSAYMLSRRFPQGVSSTIRGFSACGFACPTPVACSNDDIAHKQVDPGYTRKFAEGWERIFGKKKSSEVKK